MASVSRDSSRWVKLASSRAVQLFAAATLLSLLLAGVLGEGALPFERPDVATASRFTILAGQVMQIIFALVVIAIAGWITRMRSAIDYGARTGPRSVAAREAIALLSYGVVVLFVGGFLGVGMHLLWAYHAVAPHVTVDTPLIVRIFGIR